MPPSFNKDNIYNGVYTCHDHLGGPWPSCPPPSPVHTPGIALHRTLLQKNALSGSCTEILKLGVGPIETAILLLPPRTYTRMHAQQGYVYMKNICTSASTHSTNLKNIVFTTIHAWPEQQTELMSWKKTIYSPSNSCTTYKDIHIHTNASTYIQTHAHTYKRVHIHTNTCTHAWKRTNISISLHLKTSNEVQVNIYPWTLCSVVPQDTFFSLSIPRIPWWLHLCIRPGELITWLSGYPPIPPHLFVCRWKETSPWNNAHSLFHL